MVSIDLGLILVKPSSHAGSREVQLPERVCFAKRVGNLFFFPLFKELSEACSVPVHVCVGNGRLNEVNCLNLSDSASASVKQEADLTDGKSSPNVVGSAVLSLRALSERMTT